MHDQEKRRGIALQSMVSGGCIVSGGEVHHSLLFSMVHVHSYSHVEHSVLLPQVDVGRNCVVRNAIIDRGCKLPEGLTIGVDPDHDRERFHVSEGGVVLVTPDMLGQSQVQQS